MLYLITGANGAGKTLNTLKWVRERSVKENRPVCHNGRFEAIEGGELSSWKKVDIKDWQSEPDGTIFLVDECHNDLPTRPASSTPPDYVRMLAEHRRRGMDFYLVTQHPQNLDNFVRRLIGSPGWHRHLKRTFGADLVSCIEWSAVNPNCEKDGSGKSGTVTMIPFPKEVYGWYKSASLHTGKRKIPRAVWVALACAVLVPTLGYLAFTKVYGNVTKQAQALPGAGASVNGQSGSSAGPRPMSTAEYLDARKPRIPDFPHTAPAYDSITAPVVAPYPAACIHMGSRCECYTQQATRLMVSPETCLRTVRNGYFVDWQQPQQRPAEERREVHAATPAQRPVQVAMAPPAAPEPPVTSSWSEALAARNAQVRSSLGR
ncbi:zonular occludens toxin domain-containing protein [Paracidovorax wautersii]|uniref:zonular occludens toxin domain-containing protein n=1 Tax=Paracidovorax wautersii TaxID=1177982 RepID=UPI0031D9A1D7